MQHILYSLRFRLTVLNLAVFGFIQIAGLLGIMAIREREIRREFDGWLHADAVRMLEEVLAHYDLTASAQPPELNPFHLKGCYFQLRLADGTTLEKSSNLADGNLPFEEGARKAGQADQPAIETLQDESFAPTAGLTGRVRLLTISGQAADGRKVYLQIGARLDRVNQAVGTLRRMLLLLFPATLLPIGIGSWVMASRSLRPIADITAAVQQLSVERLGERVGLPTRPSDLTQMVRSLNQMLDRIEKGFRTQQRFAAEVSHELKTPISILLGEAQVLSRQRRTTEEYDRFVASVQSEMRALARTIESLVLLARANAGFPVPFTNVPLNHVIVESIRRCQPLASHREVTIVPRLLLPEGTEPEPMVHGDEELLCSMLTNITLNAVQHSPPNADVHIALSTAGTEVAITVRDAGPGIPPDQADRLFEPFATARPKGSGLGMSIVRSVVALHGGTISLGNRLGGGCGCEVVVRFLLATS
jgi:signal transduction histidine kinase